MTLHAPADPAGADATRSCQAPDRLEPAVWHPPSPALSSVDGPNVTAFDALVATRVRRSAARAARTAFPVTSSKATAPTTPRRLPSTSVSLDRTACAVRSRTRDPPPIPGLCRPGPASDARSPHAPEGGGARPGRFRALFTPGRTWPRAARRLLQSKGSASTTDGPSKLRFRIRAIRLSPNSLSRKRIPLEEWDAA